MSDLILSPPEGGRVIAIGNVHSVMSARRDPHLAGALANAEVLTPDGMPLVWALNVSGHDDATRVTGIDVMARTLARGVDRGTRHFFYGSTPEVLESLLARVLADTPGVSVAGSLSPPFGDLSDAEMAAHLEQIRASGADVVWVGLGMPKQELWMNRVHHDLPGITLIGVGAAFDWYAGAVRRAPEWMQNAGLEWFYRLIGDPRRLWRRYAYNNPAFIVMLTGRWLRNQARRVLGRAN
ncbi:MAG: WecB/TagA/CpsF family glycosyltransferase [Acidimicrobiia bacterium]